MDPEEQDESAKKRRDEFANYLKTKYFSDKDIFGGKIFKEEAIIAGQTIKRSNDPITKTYADPMGSFPQNEDGSRSDFLMEIPVSARKPKLPAKRRRGSNSQAPSSSKHN